MNKLLQRVHWSVPLLLISILTAVTTFVSLQQTTFANGWDSYFYLIQVKSWVTEGAMHSKDLSLIYPLLLLIYKIVGNYVIAYKVVASLLAGAITLLTGLTVKEWSKSTKLMLIVAALMLWSPHLSYLAAQYPKNLLGLCFFLLLLRLGNTKQWWTLPLFLVLNFLGHRMTAVLSLLYIISLYAVQMKYAKKLFISAGIFFLLFLASIYIPGMLSPLDFERFQGILSPSFQYPYVAFLESFGAKRISLQWHIELFLFTGLYYGLLLWFPFWKEAKEKYREKALLATLFILVAPIYLWTIEGAALRFYLIFILLAPLLLTCIPQLKIHDKVRFVPYVLLIAIAFVACLLPSGYNPKLHDPNYSKYETVTKRTLQKVPAENIELIIGHKSLAEYFTFTTWVDVLPWEVEYEVAPDKLWRIATDVEEQILLYFSDEKNHNLIYRIGVNYFFLPDYVWKEILSNANAENDKEFLARVTTWRNPHIIRPAYLLKNKK